MATLAALDLTAALPDGKPRKVQMQTDAAEKIRLVLLPADRRYRLTIGPLMDSAGAYSGSRLSYGLGDSGDYTNNASGTAVADGAIRGDMPPATSREIVMPLIQSQRPLELALWSASTSAYAEITFDAVEG